MTKSELTQDMRRYCGGGSFITRAELQRYMGYSCPKRIDRYLRGLERIGTRYYIGDVSAQIMRHRV